MNQNYKKFTSALEITLSSFDSISDWADVIEFLSKIHKILVNYMPTVDILPRRNLISKRLAQCLNPALPSGVHQKTLEVYSVIFTYTQRKQLVIDLPFWSLGLFSFLHDASVTVKVIYSSNISHCY